MTWYVLRIKMNDASDVVIDPVTNTAVVTLKFSNPVDVDAARPPIAGNFQSSPCKNIDRFQTVADTIP